MGIEERIAALERENQKLRDDNEMMMKIIMQMRTTLNRLIDRCVINNETIEIVGVK